MKISRPVQVLALLASVLLVTSAGAASKAELEEAMSYDGLQKIKVKGIDLAYARPGASLAAYGKVMLDPIEVAFSKSWDPNRTGSRFKVSNEDREKIKSRVSQAVREEFVKQLQTKSSYQVVEAAGPDVLRVKASIINLYVNAPDTMEAGRSRTYTTSAGEMTLAAELYDSETGQVLARAIDRQEARTSGTFTLTTSVSNEFEARNIASQWARILRERLDAAHGIGKK
jgi:hypothetical protein